MFDSAQQLALQQLKTISDNIRLIVIHPNYVGQHLILQGLLEHTIYVRFNGLNLTQAQLFDQLKEILQAQTGKETHDSDAFLILDECDRATPSELDSFLKLLLAQSSGRIVIFGRQVPHVVIKDEAVRQVSCFVPTSEAHMLWDYAQRNDNSGTLLEVRGLGEGRVHLNGEKVENWDGLLPRALFFYLVDRGMVTRNEIFETFWPTLSTREATNVFHVTKRKISEVLGTDLTVYWSGFYHISPRIQLSYDAALFTQMIQDSAVMGIDESITLLRQAIDLYRGDFLTMMDMKWVERRRRDLRQMYGEALISLARSIEKTGSPQEALGLYLQASTTNRQREDLAQNIMRLYHQLEMPSDALDVYRSLAHELKESLGVAPARQIQELSAQIEAELGQ